MLASQASTHLDDDVLEGHADHGRISSGCALSVNETAPGRARRFIETRIGQCPRLADVLLATSELVSNVVQHDHSANSMTVEIEAADNVVRVLLTSWPPPSRLTFELAPPMPDGAIEAGRGLAIVSAVTDRSGLIETGSAGVWFEVDC